MEGLLTQADSVIDNWERDYLRLQRSLVRQPYVVAGHGLGFATGGVVFGMGIKNSDTRQTLTGGGIILATGVIYYIGHKVFRWW
jgi:hypothetical protein